MVAIYIAFTRAVTDWRAKLQREMNEVDNRAIGRAVDSLLNYETVKYFGAEEREAKRYDAAIRSFTNAAVKNETSLAWLNIGQSLITNIMMAGAMVFTVWGWSQGRFTPGDVVLVNAPADAAVPPARHARLGLSLDPPGADRHGSDVRPARHAGRSGRPARCASRSTSTRGHVKFENLRFAYDPDREILKGVDLDVPPGSSLAVVGPSGAGKSTLARLMFRFYDPTGGRITIDGQDIAEADPGEPARARSGSSRRTRSCSTIPSATTSATAAKGRPRPTSKPPRAALRSTASSHPCPLGYEAMVGERGLKLSGGEKQRVAIARTLLKDPPILILDEATSALDSRTEEAIQATLDAVVRNRTTIVIAHRLSTVVGADQIVVLDEGRVAERGTHAELLRAGGLYAELWARQAAERELEKEAEAAE